MELLSKNTWDILEEHIFPELKNVYLPYELRVSGTQTLQPLNNGFDVLKSPYETTEVNDWVIVKGLNENEKPKTVLAKITGVTENGNVLTIMVADTTELKITSVTLKKKTQVKAMHGTILQGNEQLDQMKKSTEKFPLIFMHEITREKINSNKKDLYERESDIELFFLCEADFQKWSVEQHYKLAIEPMRELCNEFIKECAESGRIGKLDSFEIFEHARFGVYYSDSGHEKKIFNDNLSGVQLKITLPFFWEWLCKKKIQDESNIINYLGSFGVNFDRENSIGIIKRLTRNERNKIIKVEVATGTWNNRKHLIYT